MRLKKIKLAGFKSFVDPTVLELPSNLVGVVGPNGCGKSNVIDAVRWVLGESSAKNLRGESMSDVIFNGSSGRKPVGQASIELIFDNSDGSLGGEYASYAEISIRRVATRDNQSNYFLNGTRCRRRDITEIFLGTGLGPRSYAIIEQGMISRVIEAKPEELRGFLEEAAGISLYRKRRQETETRMRHTRENLARLDDVRQELDKQLERLKRQSESAERYKVLKEEYDKIEQDLTCLRWRLIHNQLQSQSILIHSHAAQYEEKMAGKTSIDLELEKLRQKHNEQSDICHSIQDQYYDLGTEVTRTEQTLQNLRERQQQLQKDLFQTDQTLEQLNNQSNEDAGRLQTVRNELMALAPLREESTLAREKAKAQLQEADAAMRHWEEGFLHFQQEAELPQRTAEAEKARLEQLDRQVRDLDLKLKKLSEEFSHLETVSKEEKILKLENDLREQENLRSTRKETLSKVQDQINEARNHQNHLSKALDQERNQGHVLQGRKVSLEALQQAALGKTDSHIAAWLERVEAKDNLRIAEQMTVEKGYEFAVETVLGSSLEAVCVNGFEGLAAKIAELEAGNLTLFDQSLQMGDLASDKSQANLNIKLKDLASPLLEKIHSPLPLQGFCDGIYVVDDLNTALELRHKLESHESLITKEGIWLGSHWLRVYRGSDSKTGILAREAELKQIQDELPKHQEALARLETEYQQNRDNIVSFEQERETLLNQERERNQVINLFSTKLSSERARLEHTNQRLSIVQEEMTEHKHKMKLAEEETAMARLSLETAIDAMADFATRRAALLEERDKLRELLKLSTQESRQAEEKMQALLLQNQSLKSQEQAKEESIARLKEHCDKALERNQQLKIEMENCISPQPELRENLSGCDNQLRSMEKQRHEFEQSAEKIRTELEQYRIAAQGFEVRLQTIDEKLAALNVQVADRIAEITEDADETEWANRLTEIGNKIQRLGAINLAAIEEYQSEIERKTYLDLQTKDLTEALETLENAIRKIDRETRARFKEVFEKVNQEFQQLFPRLFGGGQSYLELLGEDLLEAGVTIMARPPGKRNSSIHLLSGGEKALTAVALVFAIFQLNPAPFCMLDEVDAPLDDANVVRFSNLVKHMSSTLQFVYITHNKVTMEIADHLVGVTMKEPGVSRLVSVNVAEAVEMAVN
jgi:chromosome segregation protein